MILSFELTEEELNDILMGLDALLDDDNSELSYLKYNFSHRDEEMIETLTKRIDRVGGLYKKIQTRIGFVKGVKACT